MASVRLATLIGFGLLVPCHSWGCLLQRNATHHSVEPCNEEQHRAGLALATRQMHTLLASNEPAGHGAPPASGHGAAPAKAEAAPAGHGGPPAPAGHGGPPASKAAAKADLTAALRIELSMPLTIREIHEGPQGPLSHFLVVLHQQLCKSASVSPQRISLLGIRGEYTKLETMLLDSSTLDGKGDILLLDDKQDQEFDEENHPEVAPAATPSHAASPPAGVKKDAAEAPAEKTKAPAGEAKGSEAKASHDPALASADHEVIVDMEILPGAKSSEVPAADLYEKIKKTLEDPQSLLRTGPVGGMLANGELSYGRKPTTKDSDQQKAHEGHGFSILPNMYLLVVVAFLS